MKHLILILSLFLSASAFSHEIAAPVPNDNIVIETLVMDNVVYPDFSFVIERGYYITPVSYNTINHIEMKFCENFGQAIEALRAGQMVKRQSHEADSFIFMQVPSIINKDIVPKMSSLSPLVKSEFERRFNDEKLQVDCIYYTDQLARVDSSNCIRAWNPLPKDVFAADWVIL
jgi:hypothetical protein